MTLSALAVFAFALLVTAGTPGPSVAALVARVLTNGVRDVLPFLAAMWLGEALWLTLAVAGLSAFARTFETGLIVLKLLGVAYLLFLAWKMWTAPTGTGADDLPRGQSPWRMFVAGMLVTLGNPKIMLFYLALLPTIVDLTHVGVLAWAELVGTMFAVLILADCFWSLLAVRARAFLTSARAKRIANRTSAAAMAGAAVAIATR
ncbi:MULTISPECIES: LysE family translocator [Burkholderia]|uniref:Threonine/homoserine/homoserine lactone efflux protein n=1 Tax=Burkholderia pyrrocinia TaxID=60550 RepID=A0A318IQU6_BURPY|nr:MULTISPECIES: LysE family translocator [Burkholderia]PXX26918.1 threonine/homoserine/homoserine lactone efflux protein [Burkholderia pyrrocinia]SFW78827.1 Threonine/homoserine/homoserine lactone efflux protein [Burkholderia sp. NFACC33-1]SFY42587.1 Threonine/homoserine/homoserine lactone efflux protein [Burkholderia sp. NFPP32]